MILFCFPFYLYTIFHYTLNRTNRHPKRIRYCKHQIRSILCTPFLKLTRYTISTCSPLSNQKTFSSLVPSSSKRPSRLGNMDSKTCLSLILNTHT